MFMFMNEKVLVSFSTHNAPHFLEHLVQSIERFDAGYPFDLLILDNSSTDPKQLKLLEKYASKYRVETRPNHGRAQGGYDHAFVNNPNYKYYFFMHDDSAIIRDGWLQIAVDRMEGTFKPIEDWGDTNKWATCPVGKVGFQGYEWGTNKKYFRTNLNQPFHYMDEISKIMGIILPEAYQHINDDKILYSNQYLTHLYGKDEKIWNIEDWKDFELEKDPLWSEIQNWYKAKGLYNSAPFAPNDRYGPDYNTFQTISEFLNDINPMRHGFRTHCILGIGYCQEQLGWSRFWGNEYVVHYGDHVVFKRLSRLLKSPEELVRAKFKDKNFLTICDNIIRKETKDI